MSGYTMPEGKHGAFRCLAQGACDYSLDVMSGDTKDYGIMMIIGATEEAVYISREQAAVFFGFDVLLEEMKDIRIGVHGLINDLSASGYYQHISVDDLAMIDAAIQKAEAQS